MKFSLGIIILNYRTPKLVIDCLNSLVDQVEPDMDIVVVDNASNDGSADIIDNYISSKNWATWVRVLRSPINGGFAAGNNLALKDIEADAYILLNSDTIILPGAIKELQNAMEARPDAGLIGSAMVNSEGIPDESAFHFIHPITELIRSAQTGVISRLLPKFNPYFSVSALIPEPDWLGFACVLIRREVIDQVGLLDDEIFMYFEDVDYCHRVKAKGWNIIYWKRSKIVHLMGASSEFTSKDSLRKRAPRFYYESRTRYFMKHYGYIGLISANIAWTLGRLISLSRELLGNQRIHHRENALSDIWINIFNPYKRSTFLKEK